MDVALRPEQRASRLAQESARLTRSAVAVGVVASVLVGLVLLVVHPLLGLGVAAVGAALWIVVVLRRIRGAVDTVFDGLVTRPLEPGEAPRLENVVEGLCLASGVEEPDLLVVDQPADAASINAAVAVGDGRVRLVVTQGLLDGLERLELEGLLANLFGRVRDGSAQFTTLVAAVLGGGPRAERRLDSVLGDQRSIRADLVAVDLTRYPPGLQAALQRLAVSGSAVPAAPERSAACWAASVDPADPDAHGHQPLDLRIAVLAEL